MSALAQSSPDPQSGQINDAYVAPTPAPGVSAEGNDFAAAAAHRHHRVTCCSTPGLAIVGLSVLLLALAWFARRYFADPLLR